MTVETGRYQRLPRELRTCPVCHLGELEDEFHFLLRCPAYYEIRGRYHCLYRDGPHTLRTFFAYPDSRCLALLIREMFTHRDSLLRDTPLEVLPLQAVDPADFPTRRQRVMMTGRMMILRYPFRSGSPGVQIGSPHQLQLHSSHWCLLGRAPGILHMIISSIPSLMQCWIYSQGILLRPLPQLIRFHPHPGARFDVHPLFLLISGAAVGYRLCVHLCHYLARVVGDIYIFSSPSVELRLLLERLSIILLLLYFIVSLFETC